QGSSRFEWHGRTFDGADFHAEVLCTALEVDGQALLQVVLNDVTARKDAEQAAEAAARAERELVARLSHELRTPLNGIIGPVDLLAKTNLDDAQRHCVGLARDSARLLLSLVERVLALGPGKAEMAEAPALPPAPVSAPADATPRSGRSGRFTVPAALQGRRVLV